MVRRKLLPLAAWIAFVLLVGSLGAVESLSVTEIDSLEKIAAIYPQLYTMPSGLESQGILQHGRRWSTDTSLACGEAPGWYFYGFYCENGAITAVHMYVSRPFFF